jgi:hypothetical protein
VEDKEVRSIEGRRLTEILYRLRGDYLLESLVDLFSGDLISGDLPVTFLIDGVTIRGRLAPPEDFAANVDATLAEFARLATYRVDSEAGTDASQSEVARQALLEVFDGYFQKQVESRRRFNRRVEAILHELRASSGTGPDEALDFGKLSDDQMADALAYLSPKSVVTLTQAELLLAGQGWVAVGQMRVATRSIDAWWLPRIEGAVPPVSTDDETADAT